jgi:hypothetical protein
MSTVLFNTELHELLALYLMARLRALKRNYKPLLLLISRTDIIRESEKPSQRNPVSQRYRVSEISTPHTLMA